MNTRALAVLSLLLLIGGPVPTAQQTINLTGKWELQAVSGSAPKGGAGVGWGPDFVAVHADQKLTVIAGHVGNVASQTYTLDGLNVTTQPEWCNDYALTTNAVSNENAIVITETVSYRPCRRGSDPNSNIFGSARFAKVVDTWVRTIVVVSMPTADSLTLSVTWKTAPGETDLVSLRTYRRKR